MSAVQYFRTGQGEPSIRSTLNTDMAILDQHIEGTDYNHNLADLSNVILTEPAEHQVLALDADQNVVNYTLVAGTGVTITPDAEARTLTFAASGGGGGITALDNFGPPASSVGYTVGDEVRDLAGAVYRYLGTSVWVQQTPGCATRADIETLADWTDSSIFDTYQWRSTEDGLQWRWNSTVSRWIEDTAPRAISANGLQLSDLDYLFKLPLLDADFDQVVVRAEAVLYATAGDGGAAYSETDYLRLDLHAEALEWTIVGRRLLASGNFGALTEAQTLAPAAEDSVVLTETEPCLGASVVTVGSPNVVASKWLVVAYVQRTLRPLA